MLYCIVIVKREEKAVIKRILAVFTVILLIWCSASQTLAAFTLPTEDFSAINTSYMETLDVLDPEDWVEGNGVDTISSRMSGEGPILFVYSEEPENSMTLTYSPDEAIDLSAFSELCFDIFVSNATSVDCELTYYYNGGSYTDTASSSVKGRFAAYFSMPKENKLITKLELTVISDNIKSFSVISVKADDKYTYSYRSLFKSNFVTVKEGKADFYEDSMVLHCYEVGCTAEYNLVDDYEGITATVVIDAECDSAGFLHIVDGEDNITASLPVYSGRTQYTYIIENLKSTIELRFTGAEASRHTGVKLYSLDVIPMGMVSVSNLVEIDQCSYSGNELSVKGTVPNAVAVEYIDSTLVLYEKPLFDSDWTLSADTEPVAEMSMSTSFELTYKADYDFINYRYILAINNRNKIIPLSQPLFAIAKGSMGAQTNESIAGIAGVGTATIFECGAKDAFVNFEVKKLLDTSNSASTVTFTHGGEVYYFNSEYVNEICSNVSFCISTGSRVYLRLVDIIDIIGSGTKVQLVSLAALSLFIGEKVSGAIGYVLPLDNSGNYTVSVRAETLSSAIGIFTSSVKKNNSGAEIVMEIKESEAYFASLLTFYNNTYGIDNISVAISTDSGDNIIPCIKTVADSALAIDASYRYSFVLYCPMGSDGADQKFFELYYILERSGLSGIVLYPDASVGEDVLINMFNGIRQDSYKSYFFEAISSEKDYYGVCTLWDFKDSFSTFGWMAGGSFTAPETVKKTNGVGRAMKTTMSAEKGGEGILISWLDGIKELSYAEGITIDLSADIDGASDVPLTVVLGAKNSKAAYTSALKNGECGLYVDLENFPDTDKLEYIALIADAESDMTLEIEEISAVSQSVSSAELSKKVLLVDANELDYASIVMFGGAMISATIVIFAILSRRNITEKAKKNTKKV